MRLKKERKTVILISSKGTLRIELTSRQTGAHPEGVSIYDDENMIKQKIR